MYVSKGGNASVGLRSHHEPHGKLEEKWQCSYVHRLSAPSRSSISLTACEL